MTTKNKQAAKSLIVERRRLQEAKKLQGEIQTLELDLMRKRHQMEKLVGLYNIEDRQQDSEQVLGKRITAYGGGGDCFDESEDVLNLMQRRHRERDAQNHQNIPNVPELDELSDSEAESDSGSGSELTLRDCIRNKTSPPTKKISPQITRRTRDKKPANDTAKKTKAKKTPIEDAVPTKKTSRVPVKRVQKINNVALVDSSNESSSGESEPEEFKKPLPKKKAGRQL